MDKTQEAVFLALRDTEICTAAADVWEEPQIPSIGVSDQRRVLAVITHGRASHRDGPPSKDGWKEDPEYQDGCLFVMKYKSPSDPELYPYMLFPIIPELTASLEQENSAISRFNVSEFRVTLKIARRKIILGSNQMHTLSTVLEETRRLKRIAGANSSLAPNLAHAEARHTNSSAVLQSNAEVPTGLESMESHSEQEEEKSVSEDHEHERHWEWLHFYLSHKASRIPMLSLVPSQQSKPRDIRSVLSGPKLSPSCAGLANDEDGDIAIIRDEWVHQQLIARKSEYSQSRTIKLRIGTFNVNGKTPSQSMRAWVRASPPASDEYTPSTRKPSDDPESSVKPSAQETSPSSTLVSETHIPDSYSMSETTISHSTGQSSGDQTSLSTPPSSILTEGSHDLPDIFVLGFQELDLSTEALLYSTSTAKEDTWVAAIADALGETAREYIKIASKQLVGILVVVIARKEMQSTVKEISVSAAGVGIMGIMGNKGATAVRLLLNSTTVTFVCSHLAAFDEYVDRRNSDFAELGRKMEFPITWKGPRSMPSLTANIWETDVLFWLVSINFAGFYIMFVNSGLEGDLNYRIDLPDEEVRILLRDEPPGHENVTLLAYDQLKTAARHKKAFVNFIERDIHFLPTYRFAGAPVDHLGYDLKRRPAWTDRILYLAGHPALVSQTAYRSHPVITLSDHQPVSADFDIQLENHDPHEHQRVAKSIFNNLDDFEDSQEMPSVKLLDSPEVDLGHVSYDCPVSRSVRVKNEGKVACAYRFLPLEPGSPISKEWLEVTPCSGILLPQQVETINITAAVNKRTASFLNHGNTRLEDNLVLHLAKGTDYVIYVSGSYQPTCFANSLAWLVRSPGPVRQQSNAQLLPEANTLSAPRELMFLVEWLITNAQNADDLFLASADESLVSIIREHLDTQPLDSGKSVDFPKDTNSQAIALAFGDALLQFLDSLTEPVIPWVLHPRCALAQSREDVFEIMDSIPSFARNVYVTVTAFLHFIAQSGGSARAYTLARAFADILLRDNPRAPPGIPSLTPLEKRNFLLYTIA